jgi:hypothetical protein
MLCLAVYIPSHYNIISWEPVESFEGSEDLINHFWERANVGGRDYRDMSVFKAGEEFLPTGPPSTLLQPNNHAYTYNTFTRTQGKTKITET